MQAAAPAQQYLVPLLKCGCPALAGAKGSGHFAQPGGTKSRGRRGAHGGGRRRVLRHQQVLCWSDAAAPASLRTLAAG